MTFLTFSASFFMYVLNLGLLIGAVMAVLLLLRPATVRLLTPGQRVALWGVVWIVGALPTFYGLCTQISLPFPTFPDLLVSRTMGIPWLSARNQRGRALLPGPARDRAVPLELSQGAIALLGVAGILYLVGILVAATWIDIRVRRLARSGVLLDGDQYDSLGLAREKRVIVRLCERLPTSFVIRTGKGHEIALQRELSREQMRLVPPPRAGSTSDATSPWLQGLISTGLALYFWNPILWAAYYFTRRDMELACDRRVLRILREEERREYARTLVELASGRPVFGGITTFGECDAALRVKAVARWEPEDESEDCGPRRIMGWMAVIALSVFLVLGGPRDKALTEEVLWNLGQVDAWTVLEGELAAEGAALSPDTPVWLEGERHFASLCFQDSAGGWWKAMVRRYPYYGGVEAHLSPLIRVLPELDGSVPVTWGQSG